MLAFTFSLNVNVAAGPDDNDTSGRARCVMGMPW